MVAIGGGTGLSMLLRGLKEYVAAPGKNASAHPITDLAAIVTVTDDGGSSGRLRREYRVLPPGDIRNCMVALSQDEALLGRLFQYRFPAAAVARPQFRKSVPHGAHPRHRRFCRGRSRQRGGSGDSRTNFPIHRSECFPGSGDRGRENRCRRNEHSRSRKRIRRVRLVPRRVRPSRSAGSDCARRT